MCSGDIATSDVDNVTRALQPQVAAISGEGTASLMVREGVIEQIGELQTVKLLIGLRDGVTGRDNKSKVRDALRAVMHTVADNVTALRELAGKSAIAPDLIADLDREMALVRCDDGGKKETPGADGR